MEFECLPSEMLIMAMCNLDSLQDLENMILASPRCFRLYNSRPQLVLGPWLQNHFSEETLRHMAAVVRAPDAMNATQKTKRKITAYLDEYFTSTTFEFPTELDELIRMCSLATVVEKVRDSAFANMMHALSIATTEELEEGAELPRTSQSERIRIERGLLRFQIYCIVFPESSSAFYGSIFNDRAQCDMFLNRLQPWEVEEMACVHQYLCDEIAVVLEILRSKILEAVWQNPAVQFSAVQPPHHVGFRNLGTTSLSLFTDEGQAGIQCEISYLASMGLEFVSALLDKSEADQIKTIRHSAPTYRLFLADAIECLRERNKTKPIIARNPDAEDPSEMSSGYAFVHGTSAADEEAPYLDIAGEGIRYYPLREIGYVFWDGSRLPPQKLIWASLKGLNGRTEDLSRDYSFSSFPSLETELGSYWLPQDEFERLEERYGFVYDQAAL